LAGNNCLFILFTAYLKLYEQLYFKVFFIKKYFKKNRIAYVGMLRGLYLMPKTQKAWKAHISCQGPKKQLSPKSCKGYEEMVGGLSIFCHSTPWMFLVSSSGEGRGRLAGTWAPARKFFSASFFVKYLKF